MDAAARRCQLRIASKIRSANYKLYQYTTGEDRGRSPLTLHHPPPQGKICWGLYQIIVLRYKMWGGGTVRQVVAPLNWWLLLCFSVKITL